MTVVVPSLIQVKGAILSSLGNSNNFCPMEVSVLRKEHFSNVLKGTI